MLPTMIEREMARKMGFTLFTVTNTSVLDIAWDMAIPYQVFAAAKKDLSDRSETVETFGKNT
jgi:hypothetical protein